MLCTVCKDIGVHFDEVFPRHKNDDSSEELPSRLSNHNNNGRLKNVMFILDFNTTIVSQA